MFNGCVLVLRAACLGAAFAVWLPVEQHQHGSRFKLALLRGGRAARHGSGSRCIVHAQSSAQLGASRSAPVSLYFGTLICRVGCREPLPCHKLHSCVFTLSWFSVCATGAARFKELVEAKYYDDQRFFRVNAVPHDACHRPVALVRNVTACEATRHTEQFLTLPGVECTWREGAIADHCLFRQSRLRDLATA